MKASDFVAETFQAYNAARLREGCRVVRQEDAAPQRHRRRQPHRRAGARRARQILSDPADQGRVHRLDHHHRRQSLPRYPLRPGHEAVPRLAVPRRRANCAGSQIIRIYDILFDYNVLLDTDAFVRQVIQRPRVPAHDGHGRISLPARQVRPPARATNSACEDDIADRRRLPVRRALFHQFSPATVPSA